MGTVYVDADSLDGDSTHTQALPTKPVPMLNLVEVAIQWKQVVERVLYSKLGENTDTAPYGPTLKVMRIWHHLQYVLLQKFIVTFSPYLLQDNNVKIPLGNLFSNR